MSKVKDCKAECRGQQYLCRKCNYTWDINDPDPPECKTGHDLFLEQREKLRLKCKKENTIKKVKEPPKTENPKYHQLVIETLERGG